MDLTGKASLVGPAGLGTLDVIHPASALSVSEDLLAFVVYDARLAAAAVEAGLEVVAPA